MNFREAAQISDAYERIHQEIHAAYVLLMPRCADVLQRQLEYADYIKESDLPDVEKQRLLDQFKTVEDFVWYPRKIEIAENEELPPANSIKEITPDLT